MAFKLISRCSACSPFVISYTDAMLFRETKLFQVCCGLTQVHDRDCCAGAYGVALYTMRARKVKQRMRLTHHYWFCNARIRLWLLIGNCGLPGVRCIGCHECATTHYTVSVLECDASGWQVSIIHHGVAYHSAWPQQYSFWKWMKIRFQTFLSA
jgi:hypothetical protein